MIQIELDEKTVFGLVTGTLEGRINFFSNQNVIANLDIRIIKKLYQIKLDEAIEEDEYSELITLLQALAYNRYKSKQKEEIADFVLDKLFELVAEGELPL